MQLILPTLKKTFTTTPVDFPLRLSIVLLATKALVADLGSSEMCRPRCVYKEMGMRI